MAHHWVFIWMDWSESRSCILFCWVIQSKPHRHSSIVSIQIPEWMQCKSFFSKFDFKSVQFHQEHPQIPTLSFDNAHQITNWLMYQTGATMGENRSAEQKVTATEGQKPLTSPQKIALRNDSLHLRHSKGIPVIRIEFRRVDWCIRQAGDMVRRRRRNKKWWQQEHTPHTLTMSTKTALRHHSPELRHSSKGIAAIHIKFLIDWCMIQVRQMVRRHGKNKKQQQIHRQTTYHSEKKADS